MADTRPNEDWQVLTGAEDWLTDASSEDWNYTPPAAVAAVIEVSGVDCVSFLRAQSVSIEHRLGGQISTCQGIWTAQGWRPRPYETFELWEPSRLVNDLSISATSLLATSTQAEWVVGDHVRIDGAGAVIATYGDTVLLESGDRLLVDSSSGAVLLESATGEQRADLYAHVVSVAGTVATLSAAAVATVSDATAVIGVCRFRGIVADVSQQQFGEWAQFNMSAQDLGHVLASTFPVVSRPAETLYTRISGLVNTDTQVWREGLTIYWPDTPYDVLLETGSGLLLENGSGLLMEWDQGGQCAAATYTGEKSLATIFTEASVEAAANDGDADVWDVWPWWVDSLGRINRGATAFTPFTASQFHKGETSCEWRAEDYANTVQYFYGTDLSSMVEVENSVELDALRQRVIMRQVEDATTSDATVATTRATKFLDLVSDRGRYTFMGRTSRDGLWPGMTGTITVPDLNVAGTHLLTTVSYHFYQSVDGQWYADLEATNSDGQTLNYLSYWKGR